mgnify:CR=1 FL=1
MDCENVRLGENLEIGNRKEMAGTKCKETRFQVGFVDAPDAITSLTLRRSMWLRGDRLNPPKSDDTGTPLVLISVEIANPLMMSKVRGSQ